MVSKTKKAKLREIRPLGKTVVDRGAEGLIKGRTIRLRQKLWERWDALAKRNDATAQELIEEVIRRTLEIEEAADPKLRAQR